MPGVRIHELTIADEPATWAALGFALDGDVCRIGSVPIRLAGRDAGRGIVGWTLGGLASEQLDGLPTARADDAGPGGQAPSAHPNGVTALDHVVAITPVLDRTIAALQAAGLDLRRVREEPTPAGAPRQAFFRLGEAILEVVQAPEDALERSGGPTVRRSSGASRSGSRTSTRRRPRSARSAAARRAPPSSPAAASPPSAARPGWRCRWR